MPECLHCGRLLDEGEETCPACAKPAENSCCGSNCPHGEAEFAHDASEQTEGSPDVDLNDESLVAIARFQSSAEGGFFAHELAHTKHLPVALIAEEHFDAVSGRRSMRFVLSAPEDVAETAARELQQLIEQTDAEETLHNAYLGESQWLVSDDTADSDAEGEADLSMATTEESTIHWVPIVLTLAAGSAFLWGVRHLTERPRNQPRAAPAGRQHDDLWDQLSVPSGPWTQQLPNGRGRRELRIDGQLNTAVIREDADGDGIFEKEIPFRRKP